MFLDEFFFFAIWMKVYLTEVHAALMGRVISLTPRVHNVRSGKAPHTPRGTKVLLVPMPLWESQCEERSAAHSRRD